MASTINVNVNPDDGWKEITSLSSGVFTVSKSCQYCIAQSIPTPTFYGHRLTSSESESFMLQPLEKLYFKSSSNTTIAITGS
tara:strand:+ start:137 stop:382 length:246 start_codon:yes stop_codon:yes gene_type:complete